MEPRPLKKQTLVEQAIAQMEELIETGAWPIGSRIPPEPELVQTFGVSRNSIREAVKSLIHVGVLEARQGDGTYVNSKSSLNAMLLNQFRKADEREITEVRLCLEREMARLAAVRRTESDLNEMRSFLQLSIEACQAGDHSAYVQYDYQFHLAMAAATHNRLLVNLYESIAGDVQRTVIRSLMRNESLVHLHEQLFDAIVQQDADLAEQLVRQFFK